MPLDEVTVLLLDDDDELSLAPDDQSCPLRHDSVQAGCGRSTQL
jgi:hypothetical protein